MTQAIIPELQTVADALLDASARLATQQQQYAALQQSDAALAQKYGVDEALIPQLRAQIQAQSASPLASKITSFRDLQERTDWIQPGATGNVGAAGSLHGAYTQTVQPDGSALWQIHPRHKAGDPWDTDFWYLNLADFDDDVRHFYYPIQWRVPTPADYDACQQLETNWEISTGSGRMNWGFSWSLAAKAWQWYKFAGVGKGWKPVPGLPDVTNILRGGEPVLLEQEMRRVGTDALFEAVYINGTGYKVNMTNPIAASNWKRYMQVAWQADAKGQDVPFSVVTDVIRVDWV